MEKPTEPLPDMELAWADFKRFLTGEAGLDAQRRLSTRRDLSAVFPSAQSGALVRLTLRDWPRKPLACLQAALAAQVTTGSKPKDFPAETARLSKILEAQGLAWQHGEQTLTDADFRIREYPEGPEDRLPDERFELRLRYLDETRLKKERDHYHREGLELARDLKLLKEVKEVLSARAWWLPSRDWNALLRRTEKARGRLFPGGVPGQVATPAAGNPGAQTPDRSALRAELMDLRMQPGESRGWEKLLRERWNVLARHFDGWDMLADPSAMAPGLVLTASCVSEKRRRFTWDRLSQAVYQYLKTGAQAAGYDGNAPGQKLASALRPPVRPMAKVVGKKAPPKTAPAKALSAPAKRLPPVDKAPAPADAVTGAPALPFNLDEL